ncbi:kinesin motor domain protein, partial [Cooperia oncophora]
LQSCSVSSDKEFVLKGQIRVAVRVRPALGKELDVPINHLTYPGISSIKLDQGKGSQTFEFQRVFGPNMSQARIFSDVEELILVPLFCLSCLHGYNVSIIAYGQTGSGKTHTMRGGVGRVRSILPASILNSQELSFNECTIEEIYDLLGERKKLEVKIGSGTTSVTGLKYNEINALDDIDNILAVTDLTRSTAATKCNEQSSRSHAVFELERLVMHVLHLVDLAGSERVKESGAEGDRFKETTHINAALSNLQNCIRSQLNKNQHIPYRNSKLTMILRDSLGAGNSKTMVIVALNPAVTQIAETKRSLEFAQQVSYD